MKARRFKKRDRTTAGRATGTLLCRLSLPSVGEEFDRRAETINPERAILLIRHFVERHLPKSPTLLADARFVIEAEVRAPSRGIGRKKLVTWEFGDDFAQAFKKAAQEWEMLEIEEDWTAVEADIKLLSNNTNLNPIEN